MKFKHTSKEPRNGNFRKPAVQGYTVYQIGLHWLIATLVFAQLIFGESMTEAIEAAEDGETVSAPDAYLAGMHYYFGIAVLALVAARLPRLLAA
jgi:cytochrome b561